MGQPIILRHGETEYNEMAPLSLSYQGKMHTFSPTEFLEISQEIDDITDEQNLKQSLSEQIKTNAPYFHNKEIAIRVSPTARTIHTTRVLIQELVDLGYKGQIRGVSLYPQLGEVKNFTRSNFSLLVNGGVYHDTETGETIPIPKHISNPENLSSAEYFRSSARLNIDKEQLTQLGEGTTKLTTIEPYNSLMTRSKRTLAKILNMTNNDTTVICVSHQAFSDRITADAKLPDQDKGAFLIVDTDNFDFLPRTDEGTTQ